MDVLYQNGGQFFHHSFFHTSPISWYSMAVKKNTCPYLVLFKFKKSHKNKVYVTSEQQDQSFTNFHGDQFKHNNHNNHHNNPNLGWIMGLGQMSSCTSKSKDASKGLRVSSRGQRWKIMDGTMVHIHGYLGDAPFRDVAMLEL